MIFYDWIAGKGIVTSTKNKTVYTNGRPPWYSISASEGDKNNCYVIGITGGSASGKTSVAKKIIEGIDIPWVVLLSMDSFYKGISTQEDKEAAKRGDYNFDCPAGKNNLYLKNRAVEKIVKKPLNLTHDL